MPVYEITNPSDPYTIKGEEPEVCAAVLFLGEGAYVPENEEGKSVMPLFMFGGDYEGWWLKTFKEGFDPWIKSHRAVIADTLDTVLIGSRKEREEYESTLAMLPEEKREQWSAEWKDRRRSSMNNIGRRAKQIAAAMRRALAEETQTPETAAATT